MEWARLAGLGPIKPVIPVIRREKQGLTIFNSMWRMSAVLSLAMKGWCAHTNPTVRCRLSVVSGGVVENLVGGSRIGYPLPTERLVPAR